MGIDHVTVLPGEGMVVVNGAATDTLRKLREGDGLLGWEGDPNMQLFVDTGTGLWDVWTLDARGDPALVVAGCPYPDQRLVERVILADTRRFDVAGRVLEHNHQLDDAKRKERQAESEERADRLHHALLRDIGAYEGGLTRRVH
jgi:hypothetical protein